MSLSNQHLDALIACAKTGLLTEAAKQLFITQSALSQRIAALEDEIGTAVLLRSRTGVTLTSAGAELLKYAVVKNEMEALALNKIQNSKHQMFAHNLRIAGFSSIVSSIILPAFGNFLQKYPQTQFESKSFELWELHSLLKTGNFDFIVCDTYCTESGVTNILLGYERNVLVKHENFKGTNVYIDHDKHDRTTIEYFRDSTTQELPRRFLGDIHGMLEGLKLQYGLAVFPKHLLKKEKKLKIVNSKKELKIPIVLQFNEQLGRIDFYSEAIKALKEGFKKELETP